MVSTRLYQLMFFEGNNMNTVQVVPTTGVEPVPEGENTAGNEGATDEEATIHKRKKSAPQTEGRLMSF